MTTWCKILNLKIKNNRLKKKREDFLLDISVNHRDVASRVDNLEDVRPFVFEEIDRKIELNKRLINILRIRSKY